MKNFFNVFNHGVPGKSNDDDLNFLIFKTAKEKTLEVLKIKKYTIDFDTKIELVPDNFKKIIKAFKKYEKATPEFLNAFPDWSKARTSSVFQLKGCASEISTDRRKCNYSKIVSSTVGAIGAVATVSAFIFPPLFVGLAIGGTVTSLVSTSTSIGTSVTEKALLKKWMKRAVAVVKSDEENFKPMRQWFDHAEDLINLIDEIIGFDIWEEIYRELNDCKVTIENLFRSKDGELYPILKKLVERCTEKITLSAITATVTAVAASKGVLILIPSLVLFFFVAILFCKNVSDIAVTSYDIHKGSKSVHAEKINKIADRFEEELKLLKSIYIELGGDGKLL